MKATFNISLLLLGALLISLNFNSSEQDISSYNETPERTILVKYGEEVFRRENCIECHTLNLKNESAERISLDDYGGNRSNKWIYTLIISPQYILPGATMPSFEHLQATRFNREVLRKTFRNDKSISADEFEMAWNTLNQQADALLKEMSDDYDSPQEKSEILALIAFLQFIPQSPEQEKLNIIANLKAQEEIIAYDKLFEENDSTLYALANDPKNIPRGRELFLSNCAVCHGPNAGGEIGPNLTDEYWIYGGKDSDIAETIFHGKPRGMPGHKYSLSPTQIGEIISYIKSMKGVEIPNPKAPQGEKE